MLAFELSFWQSTLLKTVVVLSVIPAAAIILGYVFLLKMMAHMQSRLGPMEPGGFHGWFQLIGDGIKFIQKEDIIPAEADRRVFAIAPIVVLVSTFLLYVVLPAGPDLVVQDLDVGIFYALAVSSLSVIGVLMAGWASANKYSLLGSLRAAGQLIAYELPLVLAVVGVVIPAGTMSLQGIVHAQADGEIFGIGLIGNPYILTQALGFVIFVAASQAELTQTPFDMPVAESELVAGYMTEYSGSGSSSSSWPSSAPPSPSPPSPPPSTSAAGRCPSSKATWPTCSARSCSGAKIMLVAFLIFWMRFTFPRFREDQLQAFAWKILIPLSLANIVATGVFKVAF